MASGRRPPRSRGGGLDVREAVLAGQRRRCRAGRLAGPPGRRSGRRRRPSRSRPGRGRGPTSRRRSATAIEKNVGDGLPMIVARVSVANSSPATKAPESSVGPSGVSHHGLRCIADEAGATPDQAERSVEVVERRLLRRVADDDRRGRRAARRRPPRGSAGAGRRTRSSRRRRRARRAAHPGSAALVQAADADRADWNRVGRDRRPEPADPARHRRPADGRGVGHDPVRARRAARAWRSPPGAPGTASPATTITPSRSSRSARTPRRAAAAGRRSAVVAMVGSPAWSPCAAIDAEVHAMGLLDGKNALIFGVANDHSIAWGIAQALHAEGAEVGFSSVESLIEKRVRPLADIDRVDVRRALRRPVGRRHRARLRALGRDATTGSTSSSTPWPSPSARTSTGGFVDTSRDGFALALDVSAYSLVALAREARPLLAPGVVDPDPDLLRRREGRRELQRHGRGQGRARGVGPLSRRGPRAVGHPGQRDQRRARPDAGRVRASPASSGCTARSPRSRRCARTSRIEDVGRDARCTSRSDLSSAVTGEVIYVDGGFNIMGVPTGD